MKLINNTKIKIMYAIEIYNHEINKLEDRFEFKTKKDAMNFVKLNCSKRGYNWVSKENRSVEYNILF